MLMIIKTIRNENDENFVVEVIIDTSNFEKEYGRIYLQPEF